MNSKKRILALLMCICMIFTLLPFSAFAENAENGNRGGAEEVAPGGTTGDTEQSGDWNIEVSKNASDWHDGYKTDVTLSVPAAEKKLDTDIVFVLDGSDCIKDVMGEVGELLTNLNKIENKDKINIGAVVFNGSAYAMFEGKLVSVDTAVKSLTEMIAAINKGANKDAKEEALWAYLGLNKDNNYINKGSNLHSGLLEAQKLLQSGSADADRKYLINITDGMTYYWNMNDSTYAIYNNGYSNSETLAENMFYEFTWAWGINDNGYILPNDFPDWDAYIAGVRNRIQTDNGYYDTDIRDLATKMSKSWSGVRFTDNKTEFDSFTHNYKYVNGFTDGVRSADNYKAHALGIERSVVECLDTYKTMADLGYKCYTYNPTYGEGTFPGLFTSNLNKLAGVDGSVDFNTIENNILYAVGKDSYVVDNIGENFTLDQDSVAVKLDGAKLYGNKTTSKTNGNWTETFFKVGTDTNPLFTVEYNSEGNGTLTWTFNENLSNYAHAELCYTLELKTVDTAAGTHGQLDLNGDGKIDGTDTAVDQEKALYTNDEAILYYKATNGDEGTVEFPMPSVAYEIKDWKIPVSKTATALDKDYKTNVTLSVPGVEENLATDVLLVLDSSRCSKDMLLATVNLLNDLAKQAENGANIKVGIVMFKGNAVPFKTFDSEKSIAEIRDELNALVVENDPEGGLTKAAVRAYIAETCPQIMNSGTNIPAGLQLAKNMLAADTSVADSRKYMVFVSDGNTYLFCHENADGTGYDYTKAWSRTGPTDKQGGISEADGNWDSASEAMNKYNAALKSGTPDDWEKYLDAVERENVRFTQYDYEVAVAGEVPDGAPVIPDTVTNRVVNTDVSRYQTAKLYQELQKKYNCYYCALNEQDYGVAEKMLIALSPADRIVDGTKDIDVNIFSGITKDMFFAVGKGSTIVDTIGKDFTLDTGSFTLTVGTTEYVAAKADSEEGTIKYNFSKTSDADPTFSLVYTESSKTFTLNIGEDVSYAAPVQLSYTLTLTNPETKPGHYGQLDLNGDGTIDKTTTKVDPDKALYTNESAILNPIDSDNHPAVSVPFPKPSVEYTINRHVDPGIYTEITVEITGNSDSVVYDGTEHNVKGYTVKISDPRYTEKDFTFTGKAEASGINAGTYEMGLKADQFKNTNALFRNVKFVIKADGVLTITPKDLTITAGSKTDYGPNPVTCDKWTVDGLVAGDKVESVKITGSQNVPGSSPNVASDAVIKNAKGEDVTKNYNIKYVDGTLTMLEVLNKEDHFNYIIGTPEGLSMPTANVTRAEVATIFFRLMTDEARANYDSRVSTFSDVANGQWYTRAIATLANAGIIKGDPAGTYRPSDPITRAEMATIIARFGDFKEGGKTFSDISGHWAQRFIELAASNGWINGNPDGTFKPDNNITRAETVAMINRVLGRQTESNNDLLPVAQMTNWSDNADTTAWYYRDMQEATNNHKAERVGDSAYEKWTEKLPDIDWASYQI